MGGAFFAPGNVTPHAEYNMYARPFSRNLHIACSLMSLPAATLTPKRLKSCARPGCRSSLSLSMPHTSSRTAEPLSPAVVAVAMPRLTLTRNTFGADNDRRTWFRFAEESLRPWSDKSPIAKFVTDLTAKAYGRKGTQPFSVLMISFALVAEVTGECSPSLPTER